jgi:hypothetical protein
MPRQLIAFVDRTHDGKNPESDGPPPPGSGIDAWPAIAIAQKGGFEHVILISSARFRWDEVLAGPDDRLLPDAVPADEPPPAVVAAESEPAAATAEPEPAPAPGSPEAEGSAADEPAAEAPAPAEAQEGAETAEGAGSARTTPEARRSAPAEKRPPPRTLGELRARLHHISQNGRIDRGALERLGTELARELAIPSVACRVIPAFARDREQVAFIRSVLGLLRPELPTVLEFADGPRSTAGLGLTLAHGITALRPDVPIAELTTDRERNLGVHPRSLLHAIEIQQLWKDAGTGATPAALLEHMRVDPRLQGLAAPYQRLVRAIEFGNPAEAARAARTVRERLETVEKGREREDWAAAIHPVVHAMTEPLRADQPWSRRQLWMAEMSEKRGAHFLTALHLREALVSGLLETYGQNAARGWAPAGSEGHEDARIRPREVMTVVLADPESSRIVPDLGQVWQWIGSPRNKFVMTSPIALDPALLRDGNHALATLIPLTRAILEENRLKAVVEALPYEKAIELAVGQNAVRVAPTRTRKGARRPVGDEHAAPAGEGEAAAQGEAGAPPPADRPPREQRPRGDTARFTQPPRRGPRPQDSRRPPSDRPREVAAHDRRDGPRGPRPPASPGDPVTSIPVGGVLRVERASSGLGNLGFALKNAGLNPTPRGQREKPPRKNDAAPASAPAEAAAEASVVAAPPPPAPEPAAVPEPEAPKADFDVAGPVASEPPA